MRGAGFSHRARAAAGAWLAALAALAACAASTPLGAQETAVPVDARRIVEQVCASCHGRDGNSSSPQYPKLAQQGAAYLYDQLTQFAAQGQRRASGVMGAMALPLSREQMLALADYFSRQTPVPAADGRLDEAGAAIYLQGIPDRKVAACASCHGLHAEGLAPAFPRLAGQHAQYVQTQLREFRDGRRASDPQALMRTLAAKLSDDEMRAVAQYVAALR